MKRADWDRIFASYCLPDCPREPAEAGKWLHAAFKEDIAEKRFTPNKIKNHIRENAWHRLRDDQEKRITRSFLQKQSGDNREQRIAFNIVFTNASRMVQTGVIQILNSLQTKFAVDADGKKVQVFADPDQASKIYQRCAKSLRESQVIGRVALGYEEPEDGDGDPFDNTMTLELIEDAED